MFISTVFGYSVHAVLYANDPIFQLSEQYMWVYQLLEHLTLFFVSMVVIFLGYFMVKAWVFWPKISLRNQLFFQVSLQFIFFFTLCKSPFFRLLSTNRRNLTLVCSSHILN